MTLALSDSAWREIFAAAFVHACEEEGTYFGLGKEFYERAKSEASEEARKYIEELRK